MQVSLQRGSSAAHVTDSHTHTHSARGEDQIRESARSFVWVRMTFVLGRDRTRLRIAAAAGHPDSAAQPSDEWSTFPVTHPTHRSLCTASNHSPNAHVKSEGVFLKQLPKKHYLRHYFIPIIRMETFL